MNYFSKFSIKHRMKTTQRDIRGAIITQMVI